MITRKKILVINGSPRKIMADDTFKLLHFAALGAQAAGAQTELINLRDLNGIYDCASCFGCRPTWKVDPPGWKAGYGITPGALRGFLGGYPPGYTADDINPGPDKCIYVKDRLTPIIDKVHESDGMILGSPIMLGSISAGMSGFLTRLAYPLHQTCGAQKSLPGYAGEDFNIIKDISTLFVYVDPEHRLSDDGILFSGKYKALRHFAPLETVIVKVTDPYRVQEIRDTGSVTEQDCQMMFQKGFELVGKPSPDSLRYVNILVNILDEKIQ